MSNIVKPSKKAELAHGDCIWTLSFTEDGSALTGSLDGTVKLWDRDLKNSAAAKKEKVGVNSVTSFNNNGISTAVACFQDSTIRFYSINDMSEVSSIKPGLLEAWTVSISPSDDVVASGTHRGTVNLWSVREGHEKVASLETRNNKFILNSVFSRDLKLATAGIDGFVNVFDINSQDIIQKIEAHALPVRSVAFSPDGHILYTASDDRHVNVYDTVSGTLINSFSQSGMALSVDTSPDRRHFVVGCADHNVTLWDLGMQRLVQSYDNHTDQVWSVAYDKSSSTRTRFGSVGDDTLFQTYE
jgi:WD repeat-containing protein 61